jgi:hypothetical protein
MKKSEVRDLRREVRGIHVEGVDATTYFRILAG